ncbi:hypothetical protein HSX10_18150 [Winogradskyella undariae]|uniref:hypothetical protein n=1 Tax=Winogradskyella undariae TaxID=1285465 RepID=UPI00156AFF7C|nr:hypothetical protein [Winogradskyella undariae]NRR93499.1 hypothetical protein [Winogradskyella undariae]
MSRTRRKTKEESFIDSLEHSLFNVNHYRIDIIIDYLHAFEKYLIDKTSEIQDKISEWQNSEKEQKYSAVDYYIGDYTNYNSNFKKLKLESTFLSSYSVFEHYFKSFSEIYTEYYNLKIKIDDLSGNNYINKSKQYLEKVINLDLKNLNSIWREITKYQRIRNKIVHNNAKFNPSEKETINELSKLNGIDINSFGLINITDKEFIFNFWSLFNDYINGIIKLTEEKIKTTPNNVYN